MRVVTTTRAPHHRRDIDSTSYFNCGLPIDAKQDQKVSLATERVTTATDGDRRGVADTRGYQYCGSTYKKPLKSENQDTVTKGLIDAPTSSSEHNTSPNSDDDDTTNSEHDTIEALLR